MGKYEPKHLVSNVAVIEKNEPGPAAEDVSTDNIEVEKTITGTIVSFVLKLLSFVMATVVIVLIGVLLS